MTHAPAGWYELPNGLNEHWTGSHWVSTPSSLVESPVAAEPVVPAATAVGTGLGAMSAIAIVGLTALVGTGGRRRERDGQGRSDH